MIPERKCMRCRQPMGSTDIYCGYCGKRSANQEMERTRSSVRQVIIFYIVYLVYAIISFAIYNQSDTLLTEILLEGVFILITILFSMLDYNRVIALYNTRFITWRALAFSIGFPVLSAILVYFGIGWLDRFLFDDSYNIFYDYMGYDYPFFWAFLFIVIVAPVFEELAFRGFLFNQLSNVTTPQVTILATAIVFALVHFSFISFIWILPFGMVLGFLRHRYKTLWLGMLVHFIHNLLVLLIEYYSFSEELFF